MPIAKEFLEDAQELPTKQKPLETKCSLMYFIWSEFNSRVHLSIFRWCECNASMNYLCIQRTAYDPRRCYTIFLTIYIHWLVYVCWMGESLSATHTCVRYELVFRESWSLCAAYVFEPNGNARGTTHTYAVWFLITPKTLEQFFFLFEKRKQKCRLNEPWVHVVMHQHANRMRQKPTRSRTKNGTNSFRSCQSDRCIRAMIIAVHAELRNSWTTSYERLCNPIA